MSKKIQAEIIEHYKSLYSLNCPLETILAILRLIRSHPLVLRLKMPYRLNTSYFFKKLVKHESLECLSQNLDDELEISFFHQRDNTITLFVDAGLEDEDVYNSRIYQKYGDYYLEVIRTYCQRKIYE